ncbi:MAG: 4-(cytidine 5'-diphospho)-2-C-methyl-D-erythritol kinase [Betaproteobacteria bacterium]|nr:4-(cytidine 5'-diphospho)-2-C-methyl-D-erythritol kinase [Betaproteobacteria bacterium]
MSRTGGSCMASAAGFAALYNIPAPAKVNWFVHVLGRRADGYHDLQTVFQFIDWCDWLDFERRDDGVISREVGDGLPAEDLSVKAARLLQAHSGCRLGVHIRLRKAIPAQAGLGGGSSDAASTLLALNLMWGLGLRRAQLMDLALELGADVPVFVFGRNAFAQGVGERLAAVELPAWSLLVGWPGTGLSTAAMFGSDLLTRNTPAETISGFAEFLNRAQHARAGAVGPAACGDAGLARTLGLEFGHNDLQPVAMAALPEMGALADWLKARTGSRLVAMSGSGSAMFAPCNPGVEFGHVAMAPSWKVRKCRALRGHPLLGWASDWQQE